MQVEAHWKKKKKHHSASARRCRWMWMLVLLVPHCLATRRHVRHTVTLTRTILDSSLLESYRVVYLTNMSSYSRLLFVCYAWQQLLPQPAVLYLLSQDCELAMYNQRPSHRFARQPPQCRGDGLDLYLHAQSCCFSRSSRPTSDTTTRSQWECTSQSVALRRQPSINTPLHRHHKLVSLSSVYSPGLPFHHTTSFILFQVWSPDGIRVSRFISTMSTWVCFLHIH